jgi:tetratricopeptide (TPR) repeat protein
MDHLEEVLDLSIVLTEAPPDSPPEVLASIALQCDALGLTLAGAVLTDPLTQRERDDLYWYLEEYWRWPYREFARRGEQVEALLSTVGKRLYQAIFGSDKAQRIVQMWQQRLNVQRQISIVSQIPSILRLPWELLSDAHGFLALHPERPIPIVRQLPQGTRATQTTSFQLPLRMLFVTARPDDADFIDPRSVSREFVDELQGQSEAGNIVLEFLRPPTFEKLRERLRNPELPPIHVLHFDGHGELGGKEQHGMLLFETEKGKRSSVAASNLAKVLKNSSVRLAVLTACKSAINTEDDAFSSASTQLIINGVNAVIAMSSSILETSAARYVEAFYRALVEGQPVYIAQDRARQALYRDPSRHLLSLQRDEEATPVKLYDWWVPHFYQQHPTLLQLTQPESTSAQLSRTSPIRYLNEEMPAEPRYGFSGRRRELQQIERHLLQGRMVVLHGFGGIGKTALARETADWLTRTRMYDAACFISFEHGGDATWLLSQLGHALEISDSNYNPHDQTVALKRLESALAEQRILVIADNLESILPDGEVPLEPSELKDLWQTLIALRDMGAGVLLTTRDATFGNNWHIPKIAYLHLQDLEPDDAYALASRLLITLGIDRIHVPYVELRDLLLQLDHHPLAIQIVLPTLRKHSVATIRTEFATLLPTFTDDSISGRNRSLLASLEYSLQRLSMEQRKLLPQLVIFEGGANESNLLDITKMPDDVWTTLRSTLEQAALLTAERIDKQSTVPFLHFHPVLIPYLRQQTEPTPELCQRYAQHYHAVINYLYDEDFHHPNLVRALVRRELPNLRHALEILLQEGTLGDASNMVHSIARFLTLFDMVRESDKMLERVTSAIETTSNRRGTVLTAIECTHEIAIASNERVNGNISGALTRLECLLTRIQAQPKGAETGPGSYDHCRVLKDLAGCLQDRGQYALAETHLREVLAILYAQNRLYSGGTWQNLRGLVLMNLGTALAEQRQHIQAQQKYEQALSEFSALSDELNQAVVQAELGYLALEQEDYQQASRHLQQAQVRFQKLNEPIREANAWHELGIVAQRQRKWGKAEWYYRESLIRREFVGDFTGAVLTYHQLGKLATFMGRYAEAERWYQRALQHSAQISLESTHTANSLNGLAAIYLVQEKYTEAEPLMKRALSIYKQNFGTTHPSTRTTQAYYDLLQQVISGKLTRIDWKNKLGLSS